MSADDLPPAGCARVRVALRKPLGIVLEQQRATGRIYVVAVTPGGAADRDGRVSVGDELIATSAVVYSDSADYGGVLVKRGQQRVRLRVTGESFDTVLTAISTHPGTMDVLLDLQKCDIGSVVDAP